MKAAEPGNEIGLSLARKKLDGLMLVAVKEGLIETPVGRRKDLVESCDYRAVYRYLSGSVWDCCFAGVVLHAIEGEVLQLAERPSGVAGKRAVLFVIGNAAVGNRLVAWHTVELQEKDSRFQQR